MKVFPVGALALMMLVATADPSGAGADLDLPVRLTVVGTADFHGNLEPARDKTFDRRAIGGIDIIAAYLQAVRAANPDGVILLDAGDLYQGTLISAANEGQAVIEFYNQIGYDAVAVGNHDFDFGPIGYHSTPQNESEDPLGVIKARMQQARFPFLSANLLEKSTGKKPRWQNLRRFMILERHGIRVGVIGLSAEDTPLITNPVNVAALNFRPLLETLRETLPLVRRRGATVIVLLMHAGVEMGGPGDEPRGPVADIARALGPQEVDLIVSGHVHKPFTDFVNGVPIIQTWAKGVSFARADLLVDRRTGKVVPGGVNLFPNTFYFRSDPRDKPPTYAGRVIKPLPHFARKLQQYKESISHLEKVILGQAAAKLEVGLRYDSPVGNLVTDAMREFESGIDIAMYNSGGLRSSIRAGKITYGKLYEVVPFDNNIIVLTLTGEQIRQVLEHGLSGPYGVMEISGLYVRVDANASPGQRCREVTLADGSPLAPTKSYTVATNDFVFGGGDGYHMFFSAQNVKNTHLLVREEVAKYIKRKKIIHVPADRRYQLLE